MKHILSFVELEKELQKRFCIPYEWGGKKQNNRDDKRSNFIYKAPFFVYVQHMIAKNECEDIASYTMNRWYNFWSAKAVESIFTKNNYITANKNTKSKTVDFTFYDIETKQYIGFDHKTTVLPRYFWKKIHDFLETNSVKNLHVFDEELVGWLYENQSQQQRKHWKNRFFVVLIDKKKNEHWKIKSELLFLHENISHYLQNFSLKKCVKFIHEKNQVYASIIWIVKD